MNTYETIDLNEYVRTGEGGTAITYTDKSRNTLAKLYNPGFEADRAVADFLTARSGLTWASSATAFPNGTWALCGR